MAATTWTLRVAPDGTVTIPGMELGNTTLVGVTASTLTVKVDGGTGWSGRGQRAYRPAHFIVYAVETWYPGSARVHELTTIPLRPTPEDTAKAVARFTEET